MLPLRIIPNSFQARFDASRRSQEAPKTDLELARADQDLSIAAQESYQQESCKLQKCSEIVSRSQFDRARLPEKKEG